MVAAPALALATATVARWAMAGRLELVRCLTPDMGAPLLSVGLLTRFEVCVAAVAVH